MLSATASCRKLPLRPLNIPKRRLPLRSPSQSPLPRRLIYTWPAQCFLDKGVPEAAIRWYEKALKLPSLDEETRTALHYELASSYETAEDKNSALHHFMEVYGSNIDYRDVGERIRALKS